MEYNVILQRMLARLPSRYDKREGSVLYTLLAPVAWAIAQCHYILSWAVSLVFPDTATGDFLDLFCLWAGSGTGYLQRAQGGLYRFCR